MKRLRGRETRAPQVLHVTWRLNDGRGCCNVLPHAAREPRVPGDSDAVGGRVCPASRGAAVARPLDRPMAAHRSGSRRASAAASRSTTVSCDSEPIYGACLRYGHFRITCTRARLTAISWVEENTV